MQLKIRSYVDFLQKETFYCCHTVVFEFVSGSILHGMKVAKWIIIASKITKCNKCSKGFQIFDQKMLNVLYGHISGVSLLIKILFHILLIKYVLVKQDKI